MDIAVCLESAVSYSKRECHLASEKKKSEEVRVRENWSRKQRVKGEKGGTDRKKEKRWKEFRRVSTEYMY